MELEFDKEMDALLRKARSGTAKAGKGTHLDADAIAAFAEGAVPEAAKSTYTAHFADCDGCRKALSQVALLNEPAAKAVAATAAPAPAPWPPNAVPWYRSFFRAPGLAAAMGVLVLAFGGLLMYLVTQRGNNTASTVALDENKPATSAVPYAGIDSDSNAASASAMSNAAAANSAANASRTVANTASNTAARNEPATLDGTNAAATGSSSAETPGSTTTAQPPAAAAPPPQDLPMNGRRGADLVAGKPKTETEERKTDKDENEKETARNRSGVEDDRLSRGDNAMKKVAGGPQRGAGPAQNQVQSNVAGEMPVTRKVGGKTFHNSNGAWYDNAYHGQSTTNVHRGTDEFTKLDSGLRSIANELGGVVVVVWKSKAYRIQ
ncbi:MAG: hypothetical protein JO314_00515 [Acidobacteria bacterium]|nr:hypothetical protein [Acidobacteriota bacterium]